MSFVDRIPRLLGGRRASRRDREIQELTTERNALIENLEEAGSILWEIQAVANARANQPPPYFSSGLRGNVRENSDRPNPAKLLHETKGWQSIAGRAIADRIQSLEPLVFVQQEVEPGTIEEVQLDNHPLKLVLDRPTTVFSRIQLMRILAWWLVQCGEAYLLKVTDRIGVTRQLWPLSPKRMEVIAGRGEIEAYVFHPEGLTGAGRGEIPYRPEEIVRIWEPDPDAIFSGLGAIAANAVAYDTQKFMGESMRMHWQRDATPKTVLTAQPGTQPPEAGAKSAFETNWRKNHDRRFGVNSGLPAWLPPGFDLKEFNAFGGIKELVPMLDHFREQILMANGVPRSVLGDVVDANRAAAETNQFVFDLHTIKPKSDLIADAFTWQLAKDFDDALVVRFAEFVSKDKEFLLKQQQQDLSLKVRTINEVREDDRGLDPADWGELPVGTVADVPYDGTMPEPGELEPEAEQVDGDEIEDAEDDIEDAEDEDEDPRAAARRRLRRSRRSRKARRVTDGAKMEPSTAETIMAALTLAPLIVAVRRSLLASVVAFGRFTKDQLPAEGVVGDPFDEQDPRILTFIETQALQEVRFINETTRKRLRAALLTSLKEGETESDTARRIRGVFKEAKASRSRAIARTETTAAAGFGAEEAIRQAGLREKQWLSQRDDKVREAHQAGVGLDGMHVLLDSDFFSPVDGSFGPGPGRMSTAAANVNCRCFVVPYLDLEPRAAESMLRLQWTKLDSLHAKLSSSAERRMADAFRRQERSLLAALRS